ncbi:putative mediator of RNA polymerase II transcription subunit 24 isoform X2 [Aphidius gifuensis]|uniref:putative mediator of RNA polymerase II transcription subunit 24 isoform X2 n=1 Tax=Aphidius gifuensis TaxID=684658 RepID=UPI001CDD66EF|nr:putative mediator of RNA polymerase II transcription subunit 24 isoform X2 [Aphidius gifuensis]
MKSRKFNNSKLNCCRFFIAKISCGCVKTNKFIEKFENIDNFCDDNKSHVDSGNSIWHFNLDDIPFIDDDDNNNMTELDGPNADRIRDAWVIALERGARERLQRLPALKKIQPRDIQAILHQQINEGSASTSTGETTEKDITNSHITVTLADGQSENRNATNKLSNGTVPKNITNNETDDKKEILEKQKNHLEELKLLQPIQNNCITERRSSSPFQNGRTEVLIGETEGGPRSPRGSTSSAINDANLLNLPGETDNPEPICRSRRRSGSGVADIHLQQSQLNDNNNVVTIDNNDIKNIRDNQTGPNEMWSPGMTPGHHRELPVDVPDTLLQQAYAHKVIKDNTSNLRKQKPPRIPPPPPRINTKLITTTTTTSTTSTITTTTTTTTPCDSDINKKNHINNINNNTTTKITSSMSNINKKQLFNDDNDKSYNDNDETDYKIVELTLINNDKNGIIINNNNNNSNNNNNNNKKLKINKKIIIDGKETSVDIDNNNTDYDYPFAKEDYPTMLKTCSDSSTSTRSTSSGHSGSTAALDTSLTLHSDKEDKDKEELLLLSSTISTTTTAIPLATTAIASIITASSSLSSSSSSSSTASSSSSKLYDTTRIDLGSPCRPIGITSTQTVYNLSNIGNERDDKNCVSYDNPTYEIGINDSDENILIQNDDINDLSKLIKNNNNIKNKSINKKMIKSPKKIINDDVLLSIGSASTENLLTDDNDNFTTTTTATTTTIDSNNKFKKKINKISNNKQISSGYSTLKSQTDSSYLVLNSNKKYREVAVDVPADFIPMEKSHPTYPPNKKLQQQQQHNEDDKHEEDYDDDDRNNTGIKVRSNDDDDNMKTIIKKNDNDLLQMHSFQNSISPIILSNKTHLVFDNNNNNNNSINRRRKMVFGLQNNTKNYNINDSIYGNDIDNCIGKSFKRIDSFKYEKKQNYHNLNYEINDKTPLHNSQDDDDDDDHHYDSIEFIQSSSKKIIYHPNECTDNAENNFLSVIYRHSMNQHDENHKKNIIKYNNIDQFSSTTIKQQVSFNKHHNNCQTGDVINDEQNDEIKAGVHNGVKPAIPPRDQKRAPARPPKDNLRLSNRNSNIDNNETTTNDAIQQPQPTPQQLHSIKKYQAQLRQRKDHEERQEYLNQSLRGSRKLHALESHTTSLSGMENYAYTQDEVTTSTTPSLSTVQKSQSSSTKTTDETSKILTYGEVIVILERLQMQLTTLSGALGIAGPGVEAELEAVRTLLVQKKFATALATHHALKSKLRSGKLAKHYADDATNLSRDCVEVLEEWQSSNAKSNDNIAIIEELTGLLTSYEVEGLLLAHDSVISYIDGVERKQYPSSTSPSQSPSPTSSSHDFRNTENIKIIRIEKTNEPLGATVRNEGDAVIIGRIVRGGAADKSGLFNEGDEVLEVNGVEMRGKSVNEVCDILAGMQGSLTFLVLPVSNNHRNNITNNTRRDDNTLIHHVRAYFDYDPEDDPYIPCRELGVGFQKGDVLHVISQEDSNWWQAYREGEEDQTLAGLIPSRAFQHQREKMKQTITGDKNTLRGGKKSNTLLCTRKNQKKKKKRTKFGGNVNEDGYPLYSTTSIDDYDSEEVLTYEEVALYYPRASHKRPVVLIGPPNIGRHELRQRLMQDSERFAAAIPHTSRPRKGSEVDGQDYHFISRSQFESDILCRKFVEHGEYEKSFYGTSVEAIRSVVNSGKICVLNLHPQSLKILRNSDLKPYVVFVAPPNPEKLRQKRIKNNESFKEEELKDIIEKAREMEDKYGHLFDMIIINNDTDRAYNQLLTEINSLEREPQWVPATWVQ